MWSSGGQSSGYWIMFKVENEGNVFTKPVYGYVPEQGWTETVEAHWTSVAEKLGIRGGKTMEFLQKGLQAVGLPSTFKQITRQSYDGNSPLSVSLDKVDFFDGMTIGSSTTTAWDAGKKLLAMASPGSPFGDDGFWGSFLTSPGPDPFTSKGREITVMIGSGVEGRPVVGFKGAILSKVSVAWSSIISKEGYPTFASVGVDIKANDVRSALDIINNTIESPLKIF